ncbi:enoyl-CoA hydratase/isomerase family protein [Salinarchaeum laminariae]|uniref:enoyl-CoA hydratase/isomerase family protein n=1 Tax=Salinarchaeum laminariae TaxID=869888 RepID=UPI0020C0997D|nr:enoyl-CoA hydratase [Salinarchaeum laminariae]
MSDAVLVDVEDEIATVTLNRPDRMNPVTGPISEALRDRLDELETRNDVRCVVLEGKGRAFSAGGDITGMKERLDSDISLDESTAQLERGLSETMVKLVRFPKPTVAKVDGPAVGAGANLAIACDVVLASEGASIGFTFNQVGLSVDGGTSYLLPRVVGVNVAKELVFTGEICDAHRGEELGLFNHVYDAEAFDEEVAAMVGRIANGPTVAFRHAKRLLQDGMEKSLPRALEDESTAQGVVFDTHDHEEGVDAFLEDRDPQFEGR